MRKAFKIIANSFRLAMLELKNNKLRTFLSLLGVTFGIFCIIGVLATVRSLETNVQNDIKALGSNTIYLDKWDYSGGPDYPWWKYVKRPEPKFEEMNLIREKSSAVGNIAFNVNTQFRVEHGNDVIENVNYYGVTEEFNTVQPFEIAYGRYINPMEFNSGSASIVMGYENADVLFGGAEKAIGKQIKLRNRSAVVVGVIKKQGKSMIGGWEFDRCIIMPHRFFTQMYEERWSNPTIMIQGKPNVTVDALRDELTGVVRSIRKLGPSDENDFTLNAVSDFSKAVSGFFSSVNLGGWFIGILSLIVGTFSIANIMFVTVRERTPVIGLKKAIGANRGTILTEFLLESAFICILGGLIGLFLVFSLTKILTAALDFPVFISGGLLGMALFLCIGIGVLAGIIPASIASRMDAVVAIRSK
jgi:putative ABC transport system permease protein